jgi:hypothetical protein
MLFPTSILQTLLALYGLAPKPQTARRRPAPVLIGNRTARWR